MGSHLEGCTIYAVDFDGTLCKNEFPDIGIPNTRLILFLIEEQKKGNKVILWTNRVGPYLEKAVKWCNNRGLYFDAVNENIPEVIELYKHVLNGFPPSPKVTADVFIDDAACGEDLPFENPGCNIENCWRDDCVKRVSNMQDNTNDK